MNRRFPNYLESIRARVCSNCGDPGPNDPHHFKGEFHLSGAGLTAPDWAAVPLCRTCHRLHHLSGDKGRDNQREWLIRALVRSFREGLITVATDPEE